MKIDKEKLRKIREEKGYSLRELAERSGVDYTSLYRWETLDTAQPFPKNVKKVADALGIETVELIPECERPSKTGNENNVKIYTLNVNGFRGSEKEITDKVEEKELFLNLEKLKSLIDSIIVDKESVIVLQEVPHKIYDKSGQPWVWRDTSMYQKFLSTFSKEYKIIKPKHLINSNQCTIALCLVDSYWKEIDQELLVYDGKFSYGNKIVELQYGEISLLGLHMNTKEDMWNLLFDSYKKQKHTLLVGDFNANERRGSMSEKPKQLRNMGFNSCIPNNVITFYKDKYNSSIDNIYLNSDYIMQTSYYINVQKIEVFQTDHALCSIKFGVEKKHH